MLFFITIGLTSNAQKPKKVAHKKNNAKIAVVHRTSNGNGLATAKTPRKRAKRARLVHHHYKHLPKRGALVTTVHSKAMVVTFGGIGYRHYSGVWYRPQGKKWVVVRSPFGFKVKVLPTGHRRFIVRNKTYYYYYGSYYIKSNDEYEIVEAPVGAEIGSLPDGYNIININGEEFYELDGIYYMPSLSKDNEEILIVVTNPNH